MRTFHVQALSADEQIFRTMGEKIVYTMSTGASKNILAVFDDAGAPVDDGFNTMVAVQPQIMVKSADIIDHDTDSTSFTIRGTQYTPNKYLDDGVGMTTIMLKT